MEISANKEKIKLTQYSRGAGCGCKISPQVLEEILHSPFNFSDQNLLVGNSSNDDAAVYDLENGNALISTTDFFMPIVDDAFILEVLPRPMHSVMYMQWVEILS